MRIGIDARLIGGRNTGDRTYWRGLISGLSSVDPANEYVLFTRKELSEEDRIDLPSNFKLITIGAANDRVWSLLTFKEALKRERVDVAHVQYTIPPFLPCPVVTTIHDISFRLFPKLFSTQDRALLNMSVPDSARRAKHIITVSESSRRDILTAYPFLSPEKVTATHLAADSSFQPSAVHGRVQEDQYLNEKHGIDGPYVLSVGVLQPRKNLPMLIRAFSEAKWEHRFPHRLLIVGKVGWLSEETETAITYAGDAVRLLGYVEDSDLPILYRNADLMAYPSLYEGFGLPVLEAMACGCPVLSSNNSSLPEVIGDAGILVSPLEPKAWSDNLARLILEPALRLQKRALGLSQATKFSWAETARLTVQIYDRIEKK